MKRLLTFITALFLLVSLNGQILRYSNYVAPEEPGGDGTTDDFEAYSTGALGGNGDWVAAMNNFTIVDDGGNNIVRPTQYLASNQVIINTAISDDQFAEAKYIDVNTNSVGVVVRSVSDGTDCYRYIASSTARSVQCVTTAHGVLTIGTVATGVSENDVIRLEISGTTITCYLNGSVDTALAAGAGAQSGDNGIFTDNRIESGYVGMFGYSTAGTSLDEFEYGEL